MIALIANLQISVIKRVLYLKVIVVFGDNLLLRYTIVYWNCWLSMMLVILLRICGYSTHIEHWRGTKLLKLWNLNLWRRSSLVFTLLLWERTLLKFMLDCLRNLSIDLCESIIYEAKEILGYILELGLFLMMSVCLILRYRLRKLNTRLISALICLPKNIF